MPLLTEQGQGWAAAAAADMAKRTGAKGGFQPKVFAQNPRIMSKAKPAADSGGQGMAAAAAIVMVAISVTIAALKFQGVDIPLPGLGSSDVVQLNANNFDALVLNGEKAAFVKFLAPWYARGYVLRRCETSSRHAIAHAQPALTKWRVTGRRR